jgi:hypothetical protein
LRSFWYSLVFSLQLYITIRVINVQYSQRHSVINHCDRRIIFLLPGKERDSLNKCFWFCLKLLCSTARPLYIFLSNTDISFGLFNLFTLIYLLGDSKYHSKCKRNMKVYLIEQKIYPHQQDEWYVYLEWFITLCLWLYCSE